MQGEDTTDDTQAGSEGGSIRTCGFKTEGIESSCHTGSCTKGVVADTQYLTKGIVFHSERLKQVNYRIKYIA